MNFLSHYFHNLPQSNAYFITGCILPDILSNYQKISGEKARLHAHKLLTERNADEKSLNEGVSNHYIVDAFFHDSVFFTENTLAIKYLMLDKPFSCFTKKAYAFHHVYLEIMLDRKILIEHREACDAFYALLEYVDDDTLTAYFELQLPLVNGKNLTKHLQLFRQRKFLYNYLENERLVMVLNRINQSFGNPVFSDKDQILFYEIIQSTDQLLNRQNFPKFRIDSKQ